MTVMSLANAAWANALARRQNKPTMTDTYHPNRTARTIQQAYEDSLYMTALHLGGLSISRAQLGAVGMGRARWEYARALLEMARLLDGWRINTADETLIRNRLETAFNRALAYPELFHARLTPRTRRRNHRKF